MPITFDCECGKQLRVADAFAGKRAKCPSCENVMPVPMESVEEEAPVKRPAIARRVAAREEDEGDRPRRRRDEQDEKDGKEAKAGSDAKEEGDDRPRFGKRRLTDDGSAADRKSTDETAAKSRSLEGKLSNSGIAGGVGLMVAAVVWFVVGLAADRIFFYPPVLFIVGLVAFIKGLVAAGDSDE